MTEDAQAVRPLVQRIGPYSIVVLAAATVTSLLILGYPDDHGSASMLGHRASADSVAWESPEGLLLRQWDHFWQRLLGVLLLVAPPLVAAAAAHQALRLSKPSRLRQVLLTLAFFAGLAYLLYFGETYHAGVLSLALLAWLIALFHSAEVGHTRDDVTRAGKALDRLNDQTRNAEAALKRFEDRLFYSYSTNLRAFYEDFEAKIVKAKHRILSVERFWTMSSASIEGWAARGNEGVNFESLLYRLAQDSLYQSLVKTRARDILFIGPPPLRDPDGGYSGSELAQFYAMIYTACVLELVRTERLSQPSDVTPGAIPGGVPRLRVRCAVADVPTWVKIVDDGFFDMYGTPPRKFGHEAHFPDTPSASESAERGSLNSWASERLRTRVTQNERIILGFENYTQRTYAYVCAALLGSVTPQRRQHEADVISDDALLDFIHGPNRGRESEEPKRGELTSDQGLWLMKLFLALHFRTNLSPERLDIAYSRVHYSDIWERCS